MKLKYIDINVHGVLVHIPKEGEKAEIKEGDTVLFIDKNLLYVVEYKSQCEDYNNDKYCFKIIFAEKELNLEKYQKTYYPSFCLRNTLAFL